MARYRVEFEFMIKDAEISDGEWHRDFLDANGEGFTFEEAERIAGDLRASALHHTKWAEVVKIKEAEHGKED